jgi:3-mercaptopropionate dioxygenase
MGTESPAAPSTLNESHPLLGLIEAALVFDRVLDRVVSLADGLAHLAGSKAMADSIPFPLLNPDKYGRLLLWSDPQDRFIIVSMSWSGHQFTPLHDHSGLWCAEVVLEGEMEGTRFDLEEVGPNGHCRFEQKDRALALSGDVDYLLPPREYHRYGNASSRPARTLHVYGGILERCNTFAPMLDGSWQRNETSLGYDPYDKKP